MNVRVTVMKILTVQVISFAINVMLMKLCRDVMEDKTKAPEQTIASGLLLP